MERPGTGRQRRDAGQRAGIVATGGVVPPAGHGRRPPGRSLHRDRQHQPPRGRRVRHGHAAAHGDRGRSAAAVAAGRRIAAVLCGASGSPVLPEQLDLPLTYEDFAAAGLGLGSAQLHRRRRPVPPWPGSPPRWRTSWGSRAAASASRASATAWRSTSCSHASLSGTGGRSPHGWTPSTVGRALRRPDRPSGWSAPSSPWPAAGPGGAEWDDDGERHRARWSRSSKAAPCSTSPRSPSAPTGATRRTGRRAARGRPSSWPTSRSRCGRRTRPSRPADADAAEGHPGADHAFDPLLAAHRTLEEHLDELRRATAGDRAAKIELVRRDFAAHRRVTERFLFPMVERVRPDDGEEIADFPDRHERNARRLLDRLSSDPSSASPQLLDDIAADVHTSLAEIERASSPSCRPAWTPRRRTSCARHRQRAGPRHPTRALTARRGVRSWRRRSPTRRARGCRACRCGARRGGRPRRRRPTARPGSSRSCPTRRCPWRRAG